jgi:hypothetical protein
MKLKKQTLRSPPDQPRDETLMTPAPFAVLGARQLHLSIILARNVPIPTPGIWRHRALPKDINEHIIQSIVLTSINLNELFNASDPGFSRRRKRQFQPPDLTGVN